MCIHVEAVIVVIRLCALQDTPSGGRRFDTSVFVSNNSCQIMIDHARIAALQVVDNIGRHYVQLKSRSYQSHNHEVIKWNKRCNFNVRYLNNATGFTNDLYLHCKVHVHLHNVQVY